MYMHLVRVSFVDLIRSWGLGFGRNGFLGNALRSRNFVLDVLFGGCSYHFKFFSIL